MVGALLALASAGAAERARAEAGGLTIETGSPDALCPELASTRAAVSQRLGELIVPGGSSGFRARYTIAHAPVGSPRDFVRLELYGPEGTLQLSRDLPLEGESCSTMTEVIALVLDRYFRQLAHDRSGSDDDRTRVAEPHAASPLPSPAAREPAPAAMGDGETSDATASDSMPSDAGPSQEPTSPAAAPTQSERLALAAIELGLSSPTMPALGIRGMLELWPQVYLGTALHVGLRAETQALSRGAEVSSREANWRINTGWGPQLGPVRMYLGPGVCLGVSRGSGNGLQQRQSGYRAAWAAGLDVGAVWITAEGWSFGAAAALDISILNGRFYIDGDEVLAPEPVRAWFGMSVGHVF